MVNPHIKHGSLSRAFLFASIEPCQVRRFFVVSFPGDFASRLNPRLSRNIPSESLGERSLLMNSLGGGCPEDKFLIAVG